MRAELLARGWQVTVGTRRPALAPRARFDTSRYSEVSWHSDAKDAAGRLADPKGGSAQSLPQVANLRIGMVLGQGEGLLPHLQCATAFGASTLGSGQQQVAWIHVGDAGRVIAEIAERTGRFVDDD